MGAPCAGRPLCRSSRAAQRQREVTYGEQPQKSPCGNEYAIRPVDAENVPEVQTIASDSKPAPFVISWFCPLFSSPQTKTRPVSDVFRAPLQPPAAEQEA